jgi:hypothetical protein
MTARDCAVLTMAAGGDSSVEKAQRFRVEALPYLNDVYTVARYLLRNADDAGVLLPRALAVHRNQV